MASCPAIGVRVPPCCSNRSAPRRTLFVWRAVPQREKRTVSPSVRTRARMDSPPVASAEHSGHKTAHETP